MVESQAQDKDVEEIKLASEEIVEYAQFLANNPDVINDEDGGELYRDNVEAIQEELNDLKQFT